eukprot:scaffold145078_cov145-Phaeocystis_antarctica.AAC.1
MRPHARCSAALEASWSSAYLRKYEGIVRPSASRSRRLPSSAVSMAALSRSRSAGTSDAATALYESSVVTPSLSAFGACVGSRSASSVMRQRGSCRSSLTTLVMAEMPCSV